VLAQRHKDSVPADGFKYYHSFRGVSMRLTLSFRTLIMRFCLSC
jgi:hypothetical protein